MSIYIYSYGCFLYIVNVYVFFPYTYNLYIFIPIVLFDY